MDLVVSPGPIAGSIAPPCSKSHAQRALAAALLCHGQSELHNLDLCDDTRSALRCIGALGARIARTDEGSFRIRGGLDPRSGELPAGESGLAARLFTPIAALCDREIVVRGRGTLLRRPMEPLVAPLAQLGARVETERGHLPLRVRGPLRGGEARIDGALSSQFVTGLLMALPLAAEDSTLHVLHAVSKPYLDMTLETVRSFGAEIHQRDYEEFYIPGGQRYEARSCLIEGDWSAAAMLLAAGATAGRVTVRNILPLSSQADTVVRTALARAGAALTDEPTSVTAERRPLRGFEFDATECPDLFPALAALAASAQGTTLLHGVSRLRHKESDRAETLREGYGRLGIEIDFPAPDTMRIRGGTIRAGRVRSHGDHRIAMSLAVAALRAEGPVTIEGAEAVAKSYPEFFNDLEKIRL